MMPVLLESVVVRQLVNTQSDMHTVGRRSALCSDHLFDVLGQVTRLPRLHGFERRIPRRIFNINPPRKLRIRSVKP